MPSIKFITDSGSDIPPETAERLNIEIIPFPIAINDKTYYEGKDFTPTQFYDILLNEKDIPVTAHIVSHVFEERFEAAEKEGFEWVICVPLNSKGSNTYNAALMAKDNYMEAHPESPLKIEVMDARCYTLLYGYPIIKGAEMAAAGESTPAILRTMDHMFRGASAFFCIGTLKFAKKSGRVRASLAFVGDALGLRPIMQLYDGEITIVDKVRGDKNGIPRVLQYAKEYRGTEFPEYVLVRGKDDEMAEIFEKAAKKELGTKDYKGTYYLGSTISINAGPLISGCIVFQDVPDA